jgi:sugar phosphate permease
MNQPTVTVALPTHVRYTMIALTTLVAVMLYLDRVCLSIVGEQVRTDLQLSDEQLDHLFSAFFWSYAVFQLPAGWLGDRYGPRVILACYLFLWSACTGLMGLAASFLALYALRLGCGAFEAGAYPLANGIVRRWVPFSARGKASGCVAVGGRLGGVVAPLLTVALAAGAHDGWRRPFLVYGLVGMVAAFLFWVWFRDRPRQHPAVNNAEAELIEGPQSLGEKSPLGFPPLFGFVTNTSLWLSSLVQFLSNLAWVFLITLFPKYLRQVFDTPVEVQAQYQSLTLTAGIVGMLTGGWLTDLVVRRLGLRWGRILHVSVARLLVAIAYLAAVAAPNVLVVTLLMCLVALATDMGTAPMWAYGQDVGGRHVGTVIGWANMWGNLGAGVAPVLFSYIRGHYQTDPSAGWTAVFLVCAASQVLAAVAALGIDASRPIPGTDK